MAVEKVSRSVEWHRFAIELHVLREIHNGPQDVKRYRGGENEKDEREEKERSNVQRLAFNDEWHDCFEHPNNFT